MRGRAVIFTAALLAVACGEERVERRLVLLLTVDTLRADHLGAYGSTLGATPNIDALATQSVVFDAAFATTPTTLPSLSSLMTSRYPEEVGIDGNERKLLVGPTTLAAWFGGRGYATAAVVSNFIVRRATQLDRGFDVYDDTYPHREGVRPLPERRAAATTRAALATLDDLVKQRGEDRSLFLWVHYQDPHGPYNPPNEMRERFMAAAKQAPDAHRRLSVSRTQSGRGGIPAYQYLEGRRDAAYYRAGYAGEIAWADECIGRLIRGIEARGLMDRAIVIFAADHGESLGENEYWFAHGDELSYPLVRVPLMWRVPGRAPARRGDTASLLDVMPTLAGILGGPLPAGVRGRDLLAEGASTRENSLYLATLRPPPDEWFGVVSKGLRYVSSEKPTSTERFYKRDDDVAMSPDAESVVATKPRLRLELAAARGSLHRAASAPPALGSEEREALRALGYVED